MSSFPRRDRWVVGLVVAALVALIAGFALSAPALRSEVAGVPEVAATSIIGGTEAPAAASGVGRATGTAARGESTETNSELER